MYAHTNPKNGDAAPLVADDVYNIIMEVGSGPPPACCLPLPRQACLTLTQWLLCSPESVPAPVAATRLNLSLPLPSAARRAL